MKTLSSEYQQFQIEVNSHQVCAYSLGNSDNVILVLHGGPGMPSLSVQESHKALAQKGYRVITWDQLGCGNSDKPEDDNLWTLTRYVEEVETVRAFFNITNFNLIGQSWGGLLGLEYALKYPEHINQFVAVSTGFDMPKIQRSFERKKLSLGNETYAMISKREAENTTEHDEYKAAMTLLFHRHVCRLEVIPQAIELSIQSFARAPMKKIFGPHFYNCTGDLRNYSRLDCLSGFTVPTLLLHGELDYIDPELATTEKSLLPNANLKIFKNCSHLLAYENPKEYIKVIHDFFEGGVNSYD